MKTRYAIPIICITVFAISGLMVVAYFDPESFGLSKPEIKMTIPDRNDPRVVELEKQGFSGYRILQILNCDPSDEDRGIRANGITNETHVFDKINCIWNELENEN